MFKKHKVLILIIGVLLVTSIAAGISFFAIDYIKTKEEMNSIFNKQKMLVEDFNDTLFEEHLKLMDSFALSQTILELESEIEELRYKVDDDSYAIVADIYSAYNDYLTNLSANKNVNIDTSEQEAAAEKWPEMLMNKDFEALLADIETEISTMKEDYDDYLASLPPPEPVQTSNSSTGYNYQSVSTEKGTFGAYVIKVPLSSVKVVTASAASDDCKDNCPTKSLAQHVQDNGGFAGMNGSYFCPPDYSSCGGKVNSFDFALYKSSSGKWLNKGALGWSDTGLITFKGSSANFYKKSTDYGGGSVDAGISNYPSLLKDKSVVVDNGKLTSYQKDVKGTRGAIGVGDTNLYLAIITGATVEDAAYVMKALGAKHALNLDGGGSSALYMNGSYIVGPGRSLPNAIVLVNR